MTAPLTAERVIGCRLLPHHAAAQWCTTPGRRKRAGKIASKRAHLSNCPLGKPKTFIRMSHKDPDLWVCIAETSSVCHSYFLSLSSIFPPTLICLIYMCFTHVSHNSRRTGVNLLDLALLFYVQVMSNSRRSSDSDSKRVCFLHRRKGRIVFFY